MVNGENPKINMKILSLINSTGGENVYAIATEKSTIHNCNKVKQKTYESKGASTVA